jgi:hypothetical protein
LRDKKKQNINSFLSIDLDYWGNSKVQDYFPFIDKVLSLKKPIFICKSHETILKTLNKKKYNKVYNIDFHSDLVFDPYDEVNEGTWANFYKYKEEAIFEWRYPDYELCIKEQLGLCDWTDMYKWSYTRMGYFKSIKRKGLYNIQWDTIRNIGIAISKKWWNFKDMNFLLNYIKKNRITYVKKHYKMDTT